MRSSGGLLLLHGLHPLGMEDRVLQALEQVRPALKTHHGGVELIGVFDGVVRLRLVGSCHGCPSSSVTMKQTIEEAILARAPDVAGVEVEDATPGLTRTVTRDGRTFDRPPRDLTRHLRHGERTLMEPTSGTAFFPRRWGRTLNSE